LARADIAWALLVGVVSADASFALALATDGGMVDAADELSASSAAATSVAFLSLDDFTATLLDFRCAELFQACVLRLVYLLSAKGAPAAFSDFELAAKLAAALSALAGAARDGPPKHTNSPAASINAERPLALIIIWQSPHLPALAAKRDLTPCPQHGRKRESSGESGQKQGNSIVFDETCRLPVAKSFWNQSGGCQPDRSML
jgi:hypothetical protein